MLNKRHFLIGATALGGLAALKFVSKDTAMAASEKFEVTKTVEEWKAQLTPAQFAVLREEGTERAFTSPLNDVKQAGTFHCAGCDQELFKTEAKYDSGTGWPSFFDVIAGKTATSTDFKLIYPRTEEHCGRCGGHLGHIFDDGPQPTGKRHCMNGVAMVFKPEDGSAPIMG